MEQGTEARDKLAERLLQRGVTVRTAGALDMAEQHFTDGHGDEAHRAESLEETRGTLRSQFLPDAIARRRGGRGRLGQRRRLDCPAGTSDCMTPDQFHPGARAGQPASRTKAGSVTSAGRETTEPRRSGSRRHPARSTSGGWAVRVMRGAERDMSSAVDAAKGSRLGSSQHPMVARRAAAGTWHPGRSDGSLSERGTAARAGSSILGSQVRWVCADTAATARDASRAPRGPSTG